jgi:hypothetical protein
MMIDQISGKIARRSVIKQNEHLRAGPGQRWHFGAARCEFQDSLNLFAGDAELFTNSSTVIS